MTHESSKFGGPGDGGALMGVMLGPDPLTHFSGNHQLVQKGPGADEA